MRILITGVAGLIGSRLADWFLENKPNATVVGVDDLSGGFIENLDERVIFYQVNLHQDDIDQIFERHNIDYVFHMAAYAAEGLSPFIRKFNYMNNTVSTAAVINACITYNVKRLVFTSSLAVYGHGDGGVFKEEQAPVPIDPYGVAKYACEMDIKIAGEQHGLDWCIIRPHNVYGAKQNIWDRYRNVLGIWMFQHMQGLPMSIFGDGKQTRAFSCVDDILCPLYKAAINPEASKEIINLGGIEEYSINEANKILLDVIKDGRPSHEESRHEVKHSIPTYQKSVDILGFEHTVSLQDGLGKMWDWAQKQPVREVFKWGKYEVDKGIYSFWK
jgi:UDP-glucose 4-epimerase